MLPWDIVVRACQGTMAAPPLPLRTRESAVPAPGCRWSWHTTACGCLPTSTAQCCASGSPLYKISPEFKISNDSGCYLKSFNRKTFRKYLPLLCTLVKQLPSIFHSLKSVLRIKPKHNKTQTKNYKKTRFVSNLNLIHTYILIWVKTISTKQIYK